MKDGDVHGRVEDAGVGTLENGPVEESWPAANIVGGGNNERDCTFERRDMGRTGGGVDGRVRDDVVDASIEKLSPYVDTILAVLSIRNMGTQWDGRVARSSRLRLRSASESGVGGVDVQAVANKGLLLQLYAESEIRAK